MNAILVAYLLVCSVAFGICLFTDMNLGKSANRSFLGATLFFVACSVVAHNLKGLPKVEVGLIVVGFIALIVGIAIKIEFLLDSRKIGKGINAPIEGGH